MLIRIEFLDKENLFIISSNGLIGRDKHLKVAMRKFIERLKERYFELNKKDLTKKEQLEFLRLDVEKVKGWNF